VVLTLRRALGPAVAIAAAGTCAASASASTISAAPDPDRANETLARYVAAPGEVNDVSVTSPGLFTVRVHDPGAVVVALANCSSIDLHTAQCASPMAQDRRFLDFVAVEAGDGNDRVETFGRLGKGLRADGGPGDDTLIGSRGLADELDGGGGRDTLRGRGNGDTLTDGDTSGAADADLLDGGAGRDTASYAGRSARVFVDLGRPRTDGERGEGDTLASIENVVGGSADDRLAGSGGFNLLEGRRGDDRIDGRGGDDDLRGGAGRDTVLGRHGDDFLTGGAGHDRLFGGAGRDGLVPASGGDAVDCGTAFDTTIQPTAADFLEPGCEEVSFGRGGDQFTARAYPVAQRPGSVDFRVDCPRPEVLDGLSQPIRGTLRVREAGGRRRTLGTGTISRRNGRRCGRDPVPAHGVTVRAVLTRLGRRLAARRVGVRATVHLRGHHLPTVAWKIALRDR
jgi:hypothetical protein